MEDPACRQGRRQQPVHHIGKRRACRSGAGGNRAKPAHHNDPPCVSDHPSRGGKLPLMRRERRCGGHQLGRWGRQGRGIHSLAFRQVEGNADNHRPHFGSCLKKGVTYAGGKAWRVMQRAIGRAGGLDKGSLRNSLIVPGPGQRGLAGDDDKRDMRPHRRRKGGHQLCQPGPAGDRGDPGAAGLAGIAHGRRHRAMLMPDMDHPRAQRIQMRRHMHVGIAEQGETVGHALGRQHLGDHLVPVSLFGIAAHLHRLRTQRQRMASRIDQTAPPWHAQSASPAKMLVAVARMHDTAEGRQVRGRDEI